MSLTEIKKALSVMVLPGDIVELRILDQYNKKFCGWFNDIDKMADAALSHDNTAEGTYYTCNACVPGMLAIANNRLIPCVTASTENNIEKRRIIGIDIDPVRNPIKISSTDNEKQFAYDRALEVRSWLSNQGFPLPVLGDSGNGYHLDYFVDLPNNPEIKKLYEGFYKVIQTQFPKDKVDCQGFADANRIWKVYGTMARKGENMPDRPHRRSKLLEIPDKREIVTIELLQKIADIQDIKDKPQQPGTTITQPQKSKGKAWTPDKLELWLKEHGAVIERTKIDGDRTIFVLKTCLRNPEHEGHKEAAVMIDETGKIGYKCQHTSCNGVSWVMIREKIDPEYKAKKEACENKPKEEKTRNKKEKRIIPDSGEPELDEAMGVYHGAMELAEEFQKITQIYYDASQNLFMWKKDLLYYKRIDDIDIYSSIRKIIPDSIVESTFKNELLTAIKITGRERNVLPVPKNYIRFNDKVYNLTTKEFFTPEPTYFYTHPIPHNVGKSDNTPTIDKLFKDWLGDDAISLYEICAYCLLDDYPIHRLFILYGRGRNGKSQFMEILSRLVGIKNTTSTDLETILTSKFEAVKLYGKKLALIGETNFNEIKKTDKLKRLTGQDMVQGEFKNKDPFDFYNTAKMIVATNGIPETTDKSDGLMSRIVIKEFKNQFDEGKSVVDKIEEVEYENLIKKCIPILERLINTGKFTNEGTIEEKAARYERFSNPFPTFMKLELIEESEACIPVWVVRGMYETFCKKNGFRKAGEKEFTQLLHKEGVETKKKWWNNKNWNTAYGIQSKDEYIYVEDIEPDEPDEPRVQTNTHTQGQQVETPASSGKRGSNSQQTIMKFTHDMLMKSEGYQVSNLSKESRELYARNVKVNFDIPQDRAREYINRAIIDIEKGV